MEREVICPNCKQPFTFEGGKCPVVVGREVSRVMRKSMWWLKNPIRKFPRPIGRAHRTGALIYLRVEVLKWAKWYDGPKLEALLQQVLP